MISIVVRPAAKAGHGTRPLRSSCTSPPSPRESRRARRSRGLDWDDVSAMLLLLMRMEATLERIERLLTEDEDGEEDTDA